MRERDLSHLLLYLYSCCSAIKGVELANNGCGHDSAARLAHEERNDGDEADSICAEGDRR